MLVLVLVLLLVVLVLLLVASKVVVQLLVLQVALFEPPIHALVEAEGLVDAAGVAVCFLVDTKMDWVS